MSESPAMLDRIVAPDIRSELNWLLWIDPFMNEGTVDHGWSCRDHVWIVSALLTAHGIEHKIATGWARFLQRGSDGKPVSEIGTSANPNGGHDWLDVAGSGIVDLSPKLDVRQDDWRSLDFDGIVGGKWRPQGTGVVVESATPEEFIADLREAREPGGTHTATYCSLQKGRPQLGFYEIPFEWVNSPNTVRLGQQYTPALFAKVVLHFLGRLDGERTSLASVGRGRAWSIIDQDFDDGFAMLLERLRLESGTKDG